MPIFNRRKNEPLIPPVDGPEVKADPYAQASSNSNASYGGGDPYTRKGGNNKASDPYARDALLGGAGGAGGQSQARAGGAGGATGGAAGASGSSNPYAADAISPDQAARNELFGGYTPAVPAQAKREYGYEGREMEEDFDEDEEIEGIKQEMRGVKQESLASTR